MWKSNRASATQRPRRTASRFPCPKIGAPSRPPDFSYSLTTDQRRPRAIWAELASLSPHWAPRATAHPLLGRAKLGPDSTSRRSQRLAAAKAHVFLSFLSSRIEYCRALVVFTSFPKRV